MAKKAEISVTIKRTVQIKQYEPFTIELSDTRVVLAEDAKSTRLEVYRELTEQAERMIKNEKTKAAINESEKKGKNK